MAHIAIEHGELRVELQGMHKLWALKNTISVPMTHVIGASIDPGIEREPLKGVRAAGTHIPGMFTAGTWHKDGEKVFWDVRDAAKAVVITLRDEPYARLIVEVDDPQTTLDLINQSAS